jgi:hypothetical protein
VNDDPERRRDRQGDGANNRVGDVDEFDLKRSDIDDLLRLDLDEPGLLLQVVLLQPAVDQSERKGGAVDRNVDLGKEVRDGADVVFVAVREDDRPDVLLQFLEVRQVGHDQVDAEQLGVGEHHPAVDDQDVVGVPDGRHVHAELAQSAQRNYL